jgi:hypothetical protein
MNLVTKLQYWMREWTLCRPSPMAYVTILLPATVPFQVGILRQNNVLSNPFFRHGNPSADKIKQHLYQNQNPSLMGCKLINGFMF